MPKKSKSTRKAAKAKSKADTSSSSPFTSPLTSAHVTSQQEHEKDEDVVLGLDNNDELVTGGLALAVEEKRKRSKKNYQEEEEEEEEDDDDDVDDDDDTKVDYNEIQKRKEAKRARVQAEEDEEKRLTNLLFGGFGDDGENHENHENDNVGTSAWVDEDDNDDVFQNQGNQTSSSLFQIDRSGIPSNHDDDDDDEKDDDDESEEVNNNDTIYHDSDSDHTTTFTDSNYNNKSNNKQNNASSAWVDEDDEQITISLSNKSDRIKKLRTSMTEDVVHGKDYELRLRERFEQTSKLIVRTDWANVDNSVLTKEKDRIQQQQQHRQDGENDDEDSEDDDDDIPKSAATLLSSTKSLLSTTSKLQPHILNVVRCPDANQEDYNESTVQAVQFHPGSDLDEPLMLTAGLDKTLRFFKIGDGGKTNEKIHGINCKSYSFMCIMI